MNDHDEAIDRLGALEMKLSAKVLREEEVYRVLRELVSEAIAIREHLNQLAQRGGYA